ncbi:putative nuclease HARBI1 [Centropristis striata]|uniref:putative nuclease HARBI1 n=1 Tax=Centropristis striata TaxID=184440 RepID=UPI0027DEB5A5|nr:putative nuclease HARBI1 [Centropristis striata]
MVIKWEMELNMCRKKNLQEKCVCVFISFSGHRRLCDIKEEFYRIAGFPNVTGALDCTHLKIKSPGAHEVDFVNRKSFHSINVQMVCYTDCLINNVVAEWPGSVHDSRVFGTSEICQRLSQGEFSGVLLGDRGSACQPFLLTPFTDPQEAQQAYIHDHARTRPRVEMTFGLLKARFQCLHCPPQCGLPEEGECPQRATIHGLRHFPDDDSGRMRKKRMPQTE